MYNTFSPKYSVKGQSAFPQTSASQASWVIVCISSRARESDWNTIPGVDKNTAVVAAASGGCEATSPMVRRRKAAGIAVVSTRAAAEASDGRLGRYLRRVYSPPPQTAVITKCIEPR